MDDFIVIDEYVAPPEYEPLQITISQDLSALQVTVAALSHVRKHMGIWSRRGREVMLQGRKFQVGESTNVLNV